MTFGDNARIKAQAAARATGLPPLPTIPAWSSTRSTASPAFTPRAGPGPTRISAAPWRRSKKNCASAAPRPRSAAKRISSRRLPSPGRTAMSKNSRRASTARWSGRRAATGALATTRCSCPTATTALSAKWQARRSTACRPGDEVCRTAPAPSSNLRRRALAENRAGLRRLHPLAVLPVEMPLLRLQQPRPARADRRAALRARLCRRNRGDRRAGAGPHRIHDFLRRRHALADAAGDHRRRARRRGAALADRARCRNHARSQPDERRGDALSRLPARPASIACRSACRRSTIGCLPSLAGCIRHARRSTPSPSRAPFSTATRST